jgi:hypothetical protein
VKKKRSRRRPRDYQRPSADLKAWEYDEHRRPVSARRRLSAAHVEQADLLSMCFVEGANRLRCRLNQDLAVFLGKVGLCLRRELHIALLARTEDELPAPLFEHEFRLVLRHDVRGTVHICIARSVQEAVLTRSHSNLPMNSNFRSHDGIPESGAHCS